MDPMVLAILVQYIYPYHLLSLPVMLADTALNLIPRRRSSVVISPVHTFEIPKANEFSEFALIHSRHDLTRHPLPF